MTEQRRRVKLADVLERSDSRLGSEREPMILTCTEGNGLLNQADRFSRRLATIDTSQYKVVYPLGIVYNPYLLWAGAIAQSRFGEHGITSPVYEVFSVRETADPLFIGLLLESDSMRSLYDAISVGSIPRRRRATADRFLALPVDLPPLATQRRIAHLVALFDQAIDHAKQQCTAVTNLLMSVLWSHPRHLVDPTPFTVTELCSVIVGGVWGRPPGEADVDVLALGPRVFSGPSFALTVHGSPGRSVTKAQLASRSIQPADIILERSGGGPGQPVGRVVYAGDGLPTCIPTDFMRLLRPDRRRADPRYLFWRLQGDYLLGKSIPYQRRTTGIRNLDVPRYLGRRVTVPAIVEQEAFAHLCDSIAEVGIGYSQRIASLRATRLAISNDLLFGTHGIPPEYDTLVGAA